MCKCHRMQSAPSRVMHTHTCYILGSQTSFWFLMYGVCENRLRGAKFDTRSNNIMQNTHYRERGSLKNLAYRQQSLLRSNPSSSCSIDQNFGRHFLHMHHNHLGISHMTSLPKIFPIRLTFEIFTLLFYLSVSNVE